MSVGAKKRVGDPLTMRLFGDQSMVLEQDVLRQIRKDYHIFFLFCDEEIWGNEKPRSIFARGCPSFKGSRTNPEIVFVIIDSVFLQREGLCSLGEDVSCQWSALAIFGYDVGFVTGICDRSRIWRFYVLSSEMLRVVQRLSRHGLANKGPRE